MKQNLITFENEFALDGDGWAQLAPFGDFPGQALTDHADGRSEKVPAIQRLDRAAAMNMTRRFKSPWGKLKRFFTGCPIYAGHPDVPALAGEFTDREAKGMITDLQVREDGLYALPVFTRVGSDLVESKTFTAFSGYWTAVPIGEENGNKIFRPDELRSAGLTNRPNLPVKTLVNEAPLAEQAGKWESEKVSEVPAHSPAFSPAHFPTESHGEVLGEPVVMILNAAIEDGRITLALRAEWAQRLETDFANESTVLKTLPPCVKTAARARTRGLGLRKAECLGERQHRVERAHDLVRTRMAQTGEDYPRAFARVQEQHPALFHAMSNNS